MNTVYPVRCACGFRDHSEYELSQWETTLHCNVVSHWLSPFPEWSLGLLFVVLLLCFVSICFYPYPSGLHHWSNHHHTIILTHWGRVTHICVGKLSIIGSDNGLSPERRQAIIWTNAGILLIRPLGTNFSEILIEVHTFSFTKMHLKMSFAKRRPFCLGLNVLMPVKQPWRTWVRLSPESTRTNKTTTKHRAYSRFAPSQWETSLQSNAISHWLGANLESALKTVCISDGI